VWSIPRAAPGGVGRVVGILHRDASSREFTPIVVVERLLQDGRRKSQHVHEHERRRLEASCNSWRASFSPKVRRPPGTASTTATASGNSIRTTQSITVWTSDVTATSLCSAMSAAQPGGGAAARAGGQPGSRLPRTDHWRPPPNGGRTALPGLEGDSCRLTACVDPGQTRPLHDQPVNTHNVDKLWVFTASSQRLWRAS
jgi:hypothetical protein